MLERRYDVAFVNRKTHDRRTYAVYAFNKIDADMAGYKKLAAQEGEDWRATWWPVGAERAQ
jgi:hypothetical protein